VAVIRAMAASDLDAVLRLETATPEAPHWARSVYEGFLAADGRTKQIFVAEAEGELRGFVAAQVVSDVCELESIVVLAATRRTGLGRMLLATLINWARQQGISRMQLEVRAGNVLAVGFYEYAGFRRDGMRTRYYRSPDEDAVLMSLALPQ
jgi:[ribosomal protein S18]-alanine N-acetyltransferase